MSLRTKIIERQTGICLYGLAPPKLATPASELPAIVAQQQARLAALPVDGLIVYDLRDEAQRTAVPRPFPFLPALDPHDYAHGHLGGLSLPKIVYRCVSRDSAIEFAGWLEQARAAESGASVLVAAPSRRAPPRAFASRRPTRWRGSTRRGCCWEASPSPSGTRRPATSTRASWPRRTRAVLEAGRRGVAPVPIVLTLSPCGSEKTLTFMKWLGIAFPRWLENDLRHATDPLASSVDLCERIFADAWDYARDKGVPLGVNVESVSIRKREIEASVELLHRLRRLMSQSARTPGTPSEL